MVQTIVFNAADAETARMAIDTRAIAERAKGISPASIYRKQLKAWRSMAQAIGRHQKLSNIWIAGWAIAGLYLIFIYA